MIKENAEVNQDTARTYTVYDYGGWLSDHDTLKDARAALKELGTGRISGIAAKTVTTITIKSEHVVQTKR